MKKIEKGRQKIMEFKEYITAVKKQLSQMTEKQKTDWIYAQARIVDENHRSDFLDDLSGKKKNHAELLPDDIMNWCTQVEDGTIYFETEEYEYYEEWGWESDWRVEYHDVFGIIPYLEKAINTCYQLLWQKEYDITFLLLDRICRLEFRTDYEEECLFEYDDGLTIERLAEEGLLSIDFRKLSLCLLYACFQTNTGPDRVEKIYEYMTWNQCSNIVLTDVFAFGPEEIENEAAFMEEWRGFLMETFGDCAAKLLVDACVYLGGDDYLLKTAKANVMIHPHLFKAYCERKYQCQDYEACIAIAETAIKEIADDKVIRADISDIAIKSAKENGEENVGVFYKAAFYSDPNSWHLLRLYKLEDKNAISEALNRVHNLEAVPFSGNTGSMEGKETSICDGKLKTIYLFLLGEYNEILEKCKNDKTYLGWSYDIKGTIVPLILLLLKNDEKRKTCAERKLIEEVKYRIQFQSTENETFEEYLSIWRNSVNIPDDDKEQLVQWLRKEIDRRTENVVGGGHRNSYYKAAELIVVLGSILEEMGEINGKNKLVEYYKNIHSRKRAFKSEIDELAKEY